MNRASTAAIPSTRVLVFLKLDAERRAHRTYVAGEYNRAAGGAGFIHLESVVASELLHPGDACRICAVHLFEVFPAQNGALAGKLRSNFGTDYRLLPGAR